MFNVLEYGLYVTSIGMGGVFIVLSILSLSMWCIGRINTIFEKKKEFSKLNKKELLAVVSAISEYESEQNGVLTVSCSKAWKNAAKMEVLR